MIAGDDEAADGLKDFLAVAGRGCPFESMEAADDPTESTELRRLTAGSVGGGFGEAAATGGGGAGGSSFLFSSR